GLEVGVARRRAERDADEVAIGDREVEQRRRAHGRIGAREAGLLLAVVRAAVAVGGVPVVAGLGRELHAVAALARAGAGAAVRLQRARRRAAVAVDHVVIVARPRPLPRAGAACSAVGA